MGGMGKAAAFRQGAHWEGGQSFEAEGEEVEARSEEEEDQEE